MMNDSRTMKKGDIRLRPKTLAALNKEAKKRERPWSTFARELLEHSVKTLKSKSKILDLREV